MVLDNIKKLCAERNMTLAELERATGIGNGVIRAWNDHSPRLDLVKRVADTFGVTVDDLMRE